MSCDGLLTKHSEKRINQQAKTIEMKNTPTTRRHNAKHKVFFYDMWQGISKNQQRTWPFLRKNACSMGIFTDLHATWGPPINSPSISLSIFGCTTQHSRCIVHFGCATSPEVQNHFGVNYDSILINLSGADLAHFGCTSHHTWVPFHKQKT